MKITRNIKVSSSTFSLTGVTGYGLYWQHCVWILTDSDSKEKGILTFPRQIHIADYFVQSYTRTECSFLQLYLFSLWVAVTLAFMGSWGDTTGRAFSFHQSDLVWMQDMLSMILMWDKVVVSFCAHSKGLPLSYKPEFFNIQIYSRIWLPLVCLPLWSIINVL